MAFPEVWRTTAECYSKKLQQVSKLVSESSGCVEKEMSNQLLTFKLVRIVENMFCFWVFFALYPVFPSMFALILVNRYTYFTFS